MEQNSNSNPQSDLQAQNREAPQPTTAREYVTGDLIRSNVAIGDGASVIVNQAISNAKQAQAQEDYEREKLAQAVADHARSLFEQVNEPPPPRGNPYKYLLSYNLADTARFFGRDAIIEELLAKLTCPDSSCRLAVLHGQTGMGKTSVLQAGITPALVAAQHLPLKVRVTSEPLTKAVKESLPLNLNLTPILKEASLQEFLRQVAELLPQGKHVFVLLDQFEAFFEQATENRQEFAGQMARCLFDTEPRDHWLISIRSSYVGHLHSLDPTIPGPTFNNQIALPPLNWTEARSAALEPARMQGIDFEESLLEALRADLGGDNIDPSRLQLILNTLAESLEPGKDSLTLTAYQDLGGEAGIARDHLRLVLNSNLPLEDREPAWQILETLSKRTEAAGIADLRDGMTIYGVNPVDTTRLLRTLENNRLVRQHDQGYELTSESLKAPIEAWARQRAASEQIREEVTRQLWRVRGSALRGLFGGALGLSLAYLIAYWYQYNDLSLLPINTAYEAMPGALAGLLLILSVDIAMASYHGEQRWMRWVAGAVSGGLAFGLALLFHTLLNVVTEPLMLFLATLQGVIWGAFVGLGTVWVMSSARPWWQSIPVVSISSGLVFWLADILGKAFRRPRLGSSVQNLAVFLILAGAIMPLMVITASLLGRRSKE